MDITISEKAGVRYLHFGSSWIQGAMRIARPWSLELDYTREMMACLLFRPEQYWPRRVLSIGLGAASLTKFLYRHRPEARQTVVEINPQVVTVARQVFKLPDETARLRIVINDGADFIIKSKTKFDLILVDGFDADARTGALETQPFYFNCRDHLSKQGILVVNLLSRSYRSSIYNMLNAFDDRVLSLPSLDDGNTIVFATNGEPIRQSLDELKAQAKLLKKETGLNLLPLLPGLAQSCADGVLML